MFDQLFFRSDALTRQLSAPLVDEHRQYLAQCAAQGMTRSTLQMKARLLLSVAEYLSLAERPNDTISLPEIKKAATRWSSHNWPSSESSHAKRSREYFMAQAAGWLTFLNRLQTAPKPLTVCDQMLAEFRSFMEEDRGLSLATAKGCCSSVRPFLLLCQGMDALGAFLPVVISPYRGEPLEEWPLSHAECGGLEDVRLLLGQVVNCARRPFSPLAFRQTSVRGSDSSLTSSWRHRHTAAFMEVSLSSCLSLCIPCVLTSSQYSATVTSRPWT